MSMKKHIATLNEAERKIQERRRNATRLDKYNAEKKRLIGGGVPVVIFGDD